MQNIKLKKILVIGPVTNVFWDADGNVVADVHSALYAGRLNSSYVSRIIRDLDNPMRLVAVPSDDITWMD